MSAEECPGTLMLRSRKVLLSASEAVALEAHLERCASCRTLELVLGDFDAAASSDREDARRIERLAAFARQRTLEKNRSRVHVLEAAPLRGSGFRRGKTMARGLLAAASVLLMVAGASAAIYVQEVTRDRPALAVGSSSAGVATLEEARRAVRGAAREVTQKEVAALETFEPGFEAPREPSCLEGECPGASELFKRASAARRVGRTSEAVGLYRELQRRHPGSAEARLSHVSLGHLLLNGGQALAALKQFDHALRAGKGMRAEALYGKALSLARLGRSSHERGVWQRLLQDFPESPYAAQARRRLAEPG